MWLVVVTDWGCEAALEGFMVVVCIHKEQKWQNRRLGGRMTRGNMSGHPSTLFVVFLELYK